MTPSREAIEDAAQEYVGKRGFVWVNDPMECGQDAYDICLEALDDAEAALAAAYARDFPQPSKSDEERAKEIGEDAFGDVERSLWLRNRIMAAIASIRAEATLAAMKAERERAAKVSEHEAAIINSDDALNPARSEMITACMIAAAAIRKGE